MAENKWGTWPIIPGLVSAWKSPCLTSALKMCGTPSKWLKCCLFFVGVIRSPLTKWDDPQKRVLSPLLSCAAPTYHKAHLVGGGWAIHLKIISLRVQGLKKSKKRIWKHLQADLEDHVHLVLDRSWFTWFTSTVLRMLLLYDARNWGFM